MFTSKDIIGDTVFVSFRDPKRLSDIGIGSQSGHFLVKGHDHLGVWLAHPGMYLKTSEDEYGKPLPVDLQVKEEIEAVFLVPWDQINTIMHYPGREGFDFPDEFDKQIGFNSEES